MDDPFLVRNFVYGIEDSLLSTTGVVVGLEWAGLARRDIVVTGIILVLVEALSMSFGSFVSEDAFVEHASVSAPKKVVVYAAVMFLSYALAGMIPLAPFMLGAREAWRWSAALAVLALGTIVFTVQPKRTSLKKRAIKAGGLTATGAVILAASIAMGRYTRS